MLKIKDNIDLKELEKFKLRRDYGGVYDASLSSRYPNQEQINIYVDDREITIDLDGWETNNLDILYDLIQAGLVEKVNDEKWKV